MFTQNESLKQIAELFERDKSVISKHLKAIFEDGELTRDATVQIESSREVDYSREAIFAVRWIGPRRSASYDSRNMLVHKVRGKR